LLLGTVKRRDCKPSLRLEKFQVSIHAFLPGAYLGVELSVMSLEKLLLYTIHPEIFNLLKARTGEVFVVYQWQLSRVKM